MSVYFARYLNLLGIDTISLDVTKEKPDTLSFELASFVAHVGKLAEVKAINGRGEILNLHAGVTTELDGNAFATTADGQHYIGITFGHFLSSAYFAIESFFRTKAFTDIGAAPPNHPSLLELCPESGFWDAKGVSTIHEYSEIQTEDRSRVGACYFLTYAITMLAYFHEYYHAVLGHCPVMNRLGMRGRVLEVGSRELSDVQGKVSRALEAVADRNAILMLIKMILDDADLPTHSKVVTLTASDRIRLTLVGAGLLTASWFSWQQRSGESGASHPPPETRFKLFFATAQTMLRELGRSALFDAAGNQAMLDLAQISWRCPELATALWSIAKQSPPSASAIEPIAENIASWLDEETFRSA